MDTVHVTMNTAQAGNNSIIATTVFLWARNFLSYSRFFFPLLTSMPDSENSNGLTEPREKRSSQDALQLGPRKKAYVCLNCVQYFGRV